MPQDRLFRCTKLLNINLFSHFHLFFTFIFTLYKFITFSGWRTSGWLMHHATRTLLVDRLSWSWKPNSHDSFYRPIVFVSIMFFLCINDFDVEGNYLAEWCSFLMFCPRCTGLSSQVCRTGACEQPRREAQDLCEMVGWETTERVHHAWVVGRICGRYVKAWRHCYTTVAKSPISIEKYCSIIS